LESYQTSYPEEVLWREQMLAFLSEEPNCFERHHLTGHFTASAWLLDKTGTKALLMHHAKLDMWLNLGGHCDGDDDVLRVAIKEAQEESGIQGISALSSDIFDLSIHAIPPFREVPAHVHYDVRFLLQVTTDEAVQQNAESKALRWVGNDKLTLPPLDPDTLRLFDKWQAFLLRYANGKCQNTSTLSRSQSRTV